MRVSDGEQWSAWSNVGWLVVNSPPSVTITNPNGTEGNPTIIHADRRPTISWTQSDPEYNFFKHFELEIRNAAGQVIYSRTAYQWTGSTTNAFEVDQDLPTGERLSARMRVTDDDENLWSGWSNTVYFLINFPPAADLTFPTGTNANPTITGTTPTITWNQTDPDPNTFFTKYRVLIERENGTVVHDSGEVVRNTTATTGNHPITNPLPAGQKLKVRVMVWDQYTNSPWSAERWMFTNRPPVADFDWTPQPVYEGDRVRFVNRSNDPDGDPLTVHWTIRGPNDFATEFDTWGAELPGAETLERPGDYTVTLRVTDPFGASGETTKIVTVGALSVDGRVLHTPEWDERHERYNLDRTGTDSAPRGPDVFWHREVFVLEARTTDTGTSGTRAVSVTATLLEKTMDAALATTDWRNWRGELWDETFLDDRDEATYRFLFEARFEGPDNVGVVKRDIVTVRMLGDVYELVGVHRQQ